MENKPRSPIHYNNLGAAFEHQGKLDQAISCYQKALQLKPGYVEAHYNMGNVLKKQGKLDQAISCYQKALQLKPGYAEAHYNMGNVLKKQGKFDQAISCYQETIEIKPGFAEAYNNMGNLFQNQGKVDEAVVCYQKALEIKPDFVEAHYNMGNLFQDRGKVDEAIVCYQTALQIAPDIVQPYNNMGNALRDQGKVDEAIIYYQKALEIKPDFVEGHYGMGNALRDQGKVDEAVASLQHVVKLDPEHFSAQHDLAALTGQATEAAPPQYIRKLFDQYSMKFDHHLVETLDYKIPSLLRRKFHTIVENDLRFKNVIDLGCGTGLAGMEFRAVADRLSGIDISPKMIEEAKKKHVYDMLLAGDIVEFLNDTDEKYDLFIATDVFPYSGNLKPIFESVQNRSLRGAYFLFSTESCTGKDYVLRQTRRYGQSRTYIQSLTEKHGFAVKMCQSAGIRKEHGEWIMGDIFILRFAA